MKLVIWIYTNVSDLSHKLLGFIYYQYTEISVNFIAWNVLYCISSVQFSLSVMSDSLRPHGLQHSRLPCPSPTPGVYSNSCPSSRWCHPTISSSVIPFSSQIHTTLPPLPWMTWIVAQYSLKTSYLGDGPFITFFQMFYDVVPNCKCKVPFLYTYSMVPGIPWLRDLYFSSTLKHWMNNWCSVSIEENVESVSGVLNNLKKKQ